MPDGLLGSLITLFASAFLAATLVPAQSEALLWLTVRSHPEAVALVVLVATCGNVLGACVNWVLGRFFSHCVGHPRFPFSTRHIAAAQSRYHRYGWWSLFASWVPLIGDPITCVAGFLREPLWRFILIVTVAKGGRYLVELYLAQTW